jgi:GntR family transcriptional regulator
MIAQLLPRRSGHRTLTSATADCLRIAIQEGRFAPGHQLPAELELMGSLGVSRSTLREALRILEEQQLIVRRQGLGTYVRDQPVQRDLAVNSDFAEMICQAGFQPGVKNCRIHLSQSHSEAAQALHLDEGEGVVEIDRVLTADERAAIWVREFLPASLSQGSCAYVHDLGTSSVIRFVEERLHIRVVRGTAHLHPVTATTGIARKLGISQGIPLLSITQSDYDVDNFPVRCSTAIYTPDLLVFTVNRRGPFW